MVSKLVMTKELFLFIVSIAAVACSADCLPEEETPAMRTVSFSASIDKEGEFPGEGRASVSDAGVLTWHSGDKIAVLDDSGTFREFSLSSGSGTTLATFTGTMPAGRHATTVAVFPWRAEHSWSSSDGLSLALPDEYSTTESGKALMPMIATFTSEGQRLRFRQAGALMKLTLQDIPSGASSLRLSSRGKRLSGFFTIPDVFAEDAATAAEATVEGDSTVTVNFSRTASEMSFFLPLPSVTLNGFTIDLYNSSGTLLGRKRAPATQAVPRGRFLQMPAVALTPVTEYKKLKFIEYNVLQGMINDYLNNMDNFVAWVNWRSPDVLVICEGRTYGNDQSISDDNRPMPNNIAALAARWGHAYYKVGANKHGNPVIITSRYPVTLIQNLTDDVYANGVLHVRIEGFDIVATHLWYAHDSEEDEGVRTAEMLAATGATILNSKYANIENWILTGDLNSYWTPDKEHYGWHTERDYFWVVQDYIHAHWGHDVLYERNKGAWLPTMYHGQTRLDYFFASDAIYPHILEARVLHDSFTDLYTSQNKAGSSDHRPLQVVYERAVFSEEQNAGVWDMAPVNGAWQ